ncbi:hypothetical protein CesoFtcFv8_009226 [Champsocephalus esox]|uniref:Uncharacterized protein n=1 Tax=Champsocephalus esox TaxID=159716 RepID=A0AAN8CA50_9TELE|nr:hypothetical protein CesoFtcFv8_009226 [Champsocephalus esox]
MFWVGGFSVLIRENTAVSCHCASNLPYRLGRDPSFSSESLLLPHRRTDGTLFGLPWEVTCRDKTAEWATSPVHEE